MAHPSRKHLLVEGQDDKYAIVELMAAHVPWGNQKSDWPVEIEVCGGVEEVLAPGFIPTKLTSREVEILGIIIDANDDFDSRWRRLHALCKPAFPELPDHLSAAGCVCLNEDGKRVGIWIMPDNASRGMLETFARFLVPDQQEPVWAVARKAVSEAVAVGARVQAIDLAKAEMYTWLAWQDRPGQSLGRALLQNILDPRSPRAASFVAWFRQLFQL